MLQRLLIRTTSLRLLSTKRLIGQRPDETRLTPLAVWHPSRDTGSDRSGDAILARKTLAGCHGMLPAAQMRIVAADLANQGDIIRSQLVGNAAPHHNLSADYGAKGTKCLIHQTI